MLFNSLYFFALFPIVFFLSLNIVQKPTIDMFKNDWKGTSLALAQQVIKDLLPYSNSWLKNWTPLDKYVDGSGVIKDYDIANMKRVAMEMSIYIGLYTTILALKGLASDWDDDDPRKYAVNLLLNQGTRLRTDVLLYLNPLEAQKLIQDPIPSIKIITDFSKWTSAVSKTIIDGSPEYETGTFRGHNRILRTTLGLFQKGNFSVVAAVAASIRS